MTTILLSDAQRDTFAATGLIVIDGEPCLLQHPLECDGRHPDTIAPEEGWRILTEPCDTCGGIDFDQDGHRVPCINPDCVGGRRVVTLTATCEHLNAGTIVHAVDDDPLGGDWSCPDCGADDGAPDGGVVTLGRLTVPALLPVMGDHRGMDWPGPFVERIGDGAWLWLSTDSGDCHELSLDPLPHHGQFVAIPEAVEVGHAANV